MLAFESLTPEALLKEVAEYILAESLRENQTVTVLNRKAKLTRAENIRLEKAHSVVNALHRIADDLAGAAIIPANSALRTIPAGKLIASTPAAPDESDLTIAAKAIVYQRDYKALHGHYDATQPNPDAEPDQQYDDWAADILATALAQ